MSALAWMLLPVSIGLAFAGDEGSPRAQKPAVMGYLASWNVGEDERQISDIPADRLTHLFYAFGGISQEGLAELADPCLDIGACAPDVALGPAGNFAELTELKQRHPQLKVMISIGGWTGSTYFSEIAANARSRERFVRSAIDVFIRPYPGLFDGIDIDWEYPVGGGLPENKTSPADRINFTRLMAEFRRQLDGLRHPDGDRYLLSIATSADIENIANIEPAKLAGIVDWIGVMTYDYHAGSTIAHFNAPLFALPDDPSPHANVDASMRAYVEAGVPRTKLLVGIPFYGRGYGKVEGTDDGLLQSGDPNGAEEWGGSDGIDYRVLVARRPQAQGFRRFWNEAAQVPFLYNADSRIWISYENPDSVARKASYARENGFAGVMFWELGADDGRLLNAVERALNADPGAECGYLPTSGEGVPRHCNDGGRDRD